MHASLPTSSFRGCTNIAIVASPSSSCSPTGVNRPRARCGPPILAVSRSIARMGETCLSSLSDRQSGERRFGTSGAKYEYHVRIRGDNGSLASGHCALTGRAENPMPKLFKQFRQRFGISAPKMTVQTHVAWYWRWLGMLVFLSLALALAAWMYDAGRRFAGFDRSELQNEF